MNFWNAILESNTFNFAVLLLIFALLAQKLDIKAVLETLKNNIVKAIEDAKTQRSEADAKLKKAENSVKNLDTEIKQLLNNASLKADSLSDVIIQNANEQVMLIEQNVQKIITAEENTLSAKLTDDVLKSASKLAKDRIKVMLKENPQLHDKFIEKSIGEL